MGACGVLCGVLALGGSLLGLPRVPAREPSAEFVREMVSVLNETESSDALIAAVLALQRANVDGQLVVPAIIRNAERLKLFADTPPKQGTEQQKAVLKGIVGLLKGPQALLPIVVNQYSSDPTARMEKLLHGSEDLRQIHDEWRRYWMNDQPEHMANQRVRGGIGP